MGTPAQAARVRRSTVLVESRESLATGGWFDLGEHAKVIIMSVTEGEDTPLMYRGALCTAGLLVVNKVDLLPYVEFDIRYCISLARSFRPDLPIAFVSARTGEGVEALAAWLRSVPDGSNTSAPP